MTSFPRTDAFGFEILLPTRRNVRAVLLRTLVIDQMIAIPVALVLTSALGDFWDKLVIATVYAQSIGLLCGTSSCWTIEWLDTQTPWRGQAGIMTQYFVCGVIGAELARRLCGVIYGPGFYAGPPVVSWAIGATIALLVGGAMMTMRQLRTRLISTELEALQARGRRPGDAGNHRPASVIQPRDQDQLGRQRGLGARPRRAHEQRLVPSVEPPAVAMVLQDDVHSPLKRVLRAGDGADGASVLRILLEDFRVPLEPLTDDVRQRAAPRRAGAGRGAGNQRDLEPARRHGSHPRRHQAI